MNQILTIWRLQFLYNLWRLTSYIRSSLISSFQSSLSNLKRGQPFLGALVAVVRSIRYMYEEKKIGGKSSLKNHKLFGIQSK